MQRYQDVILNSNGQPVSGAAVVVRATGTSTAAATIYGTNTGTSTRANPLTADSNGRFWFYGTNGRYDLVVSGSYITTTTAADVMLEDVPLTNLAELSTASSARDNLGLGSAAVVSTATFLKVANNLSDIANSTSARINLGDYTTATNTWSKGQRGAVVVLASTGQITPDFNASNNFSLAMSVNTTLATPTNVAAGQAGCIAITQNATAKTLALSSFWKFAGTLTGTLSTATGVTDVLTYYAFSTSAAASSMLNNVA